MSFFLTYKKNILTSSRNKIHTSIYANLYEYGVHFVCIQSLYLHLKLNVQKLSSVCSSSNTQKIIMYEFANMCQTLCIEKCLTITIFVHFRWYCCDDIRHNYSNCWHFANVHSLVGLLHIKGESKTLYST